METFYLHSLTPSLQATSDLSVCEAQAAAITGVPARTVCRVVMEKRR